MHHGLAVESRMKIHIKTAAELARLCKRIEPTGLGENGHLDPLGRHLGWAIRT